MNEITEKRCQQGAEGSSVGVLTDTPSVIIIIEKMLTIIKKGDVSGSVGAIKDA